MEETLFQNTITLRDYIRVLFRYKWVVFITTITVVTVVAVGLKLKTPVYSSSVKMLISAEKQVESPFYRDILSSRSSEITLTQSEIVMSEPVLKRVVNALGLYQRPLDYEKEFASSIKDLVIARRVKSFEKKYSSLTEEQRKGLLFRQAMEILRNSITVSPIRDTNLFTISVRDYNQFFATIIANVVSRSYIIFDLEQQLAEMEMKYGKKHPAVKQLLDHIEKMQESLNGKPLESIDALGPASVKIVEQAQVPLKPSGSPEMLTFLLAVIMGPFLGIMLAFVFEYLDQTFRTPHDIESILNVPYLGAIPRKCLTSTALIKEKDKLKSLYAKAYQTFVDQLYMVIKDKKIKTIGVTSVLDKEGASTCVANVATLLANKLNHKVLVIDGNLRNPALHKKFKVTASKQKGLCDLLQGQAAFEEIAQKCGSKVTVIAAGQTELNPITLLDSQKMKEFLIWAKKEFEIVIVDCPALRDCKDTYILAESLDYLILVIAEGATRKQVIKSALASLEDKEKKVLGAVLNHRTYPIPGFIYNLT